MKSITEFWAHTLAKGLTSKTALTTEGKTPEEIATAIGEAFKYEGDKLKHFLAAIDVAAQNADKLSRVLVITMGEGETAPPKAVKVEETHYVPEFQAPPRAVNLAKPESRGGGGPKKGGKSANSPKTSPWGLTPEEKAAKKGGGKTAPKA